MSSRFFHKAMRQEVELWLTAYRRAKVPFSCDSRSCPGIRWAGHRGHDAEFVLLAPGETAVTAKVGLFFCRHCAVRLLESMRRQGETWKLVEINRWHATRAAMKKERAA